MSIRKFSKILLFSLSAVFVFPISSFSQTEETLTIATYYPAPYGSYNELETRILYFGEEQNGLIAFNYPADNIRDRRLRITAGKQDGVANTQGAAVDLHGNDRPGDTGVGGELHLVAGSAGGPILFYTGDPVDEAMRITNTGNVGIGTSTPFGVLDIEADDPNEAALYARTADLRGLEIVPNLGAGGWNPLSQPGDVGLIFRDNGGIEGGALVIGQWSNSPRARGIRIDVEGNVGIGIANPQATLDVAGGVKIGDDPICGPGKEGTIRYNGIAMQFCDGSTWRDI